MSGGGSAEASPLEACPVVISLPVQWGEMDAFGHVNNVVYFRYFESVRIAYFDRIDYMAVMDRTGVGPIVASASCRFRKALEYPDALRVGARATDLSEDRFTMLCYVWSERHEAVCAEGETRIVSFDYRTNEKAPLQAEVRDRILGLEGI